MPNIVEHTSSNRRLRARRFDRSSRAAEDFVLRLGTLLHGAGAPAHRLEDALETCAGSWGLEAQFFSTPTSLFCAFGAGPAQTVHLQRVRPAGANLARLVEVDELLEEIASAGLAPAASLTRLERIEERGPRYRTAAGVVAFASVAGAAAVFFGGAPADVSLSALIGLLLGGLGVLLHRSPVSMQLFEPLAAFVAAFLACVGAWLVDGLSDRVTTLSALIVLVPGLMLTVGLSEIATTHWISGTARLAGAAAAFLSLGLGVALGRHLGTQLPGFVSRDGAANLPEWALLVALLVATAAFTVLFGARVREALWIQLAGLTGFVGARLGASILGPELGVFVGAMFVGVGSNVYARALRRPALVLQLPGLLLLVPGSLGFQSLSSFLAHDALSGIEAAFRMLLVAAALVGGLFVANALLPPRRSL